MFIGVTGFFLMGQHIWGRKHGRIFGGFRFQPYPDESVSVIMPNGVNLV